MKTQFFLVLKREYYACIRKPNDWVSSVFFFFIVCSLFPIAIGANRELLYRMAPGIFWIALILAIMLSVAKLFEEEADNGILEQIFFGQISLSFWVFAKVFAYSLILIALFLAVIPFFSIFFGLDAADALVLSVTVVLGVPSLCFIGAMGSALMLGLRVGGVILSLVIFPFFIPILIFGVGAAQAVQMGFSPLDNISILVAFLMMLSFFSPFVISFSLKISMDS